MVRTGAAVAEAPAGRWLRAWVAVVREMEKRIKLLTSRERRQNTADHVILRLKYLRIRWEAIMRGTGVFVVVVGRMVLKV